MKKLIHKLSWFLIVLIGGLLLFGVFLVFAPSSISHKIVPTIDLAGFLVLLWLFLLIVFVILLFNKMYDRLK